VVLFNDKPDETGYLLEAFPELVAYVRREINDKRYSEKDFEFLKKVFGERVEYSDNLKDLKNKFEQKYF
jgi:regulator of sirC expression with transglutaminase-like and TPR domain